MTFSSFELDEPDLFTLGAIGEPGNRVFYLQARQAGQVVTLRIEKEQAFALTEYLGGLLENLPSAGSEVPEHLDLLQPAIEEWAVGSLAVAFDESNDRILVVAEELSVAETDTEDAAPDPDVATARFHLTRGQVAAFVPHSTAVIKAGRPLCQVCGRSIDPNGHMCPRSNGHRR